MELCLICGENVNYLARHLKYQHKDLNISLHWYYDKFLKTDKEGECITCNKKTVFKCIKYGYAKFCSQICSAKTNSKKLIGVPRSLETKQKISYVKKEFYKTEKGKSFIQKLSIERRGKNNPVYKQSAETKKRVALNNSIKMKKLIKEGKFTPCITNSWANSSCKIFINKNRWFRSTWEAVFYILNPNLLYEKTRIPYYDLKGVYHNYIVDFTDENNRILYEVKPKRTQHIIINKIKETAAEKWCLKNNYTYKIIDDEYFRENAKKIDYSQYDPKIKKGMLQFLVEKI